MVIRRTTDILVSSPLAHTAVTTSNTSFIRLQLKARLSSQTSLLFTSPGSLNDYPPQGYRHRQACFWHYLCQLTAQSITCLENMKNLSFSSCSLCSPLRVRVCTRMCVLTPASLAPTSIISKIATSQTWLHFHPLANAFSWPPSTAAPLQDKFPEVPGICGLRPQSSARREVSTGKARRHHTDEVLYQ